MNARTQLRVITTLTAPTPLGHSSAHVSQVMLEMDTRLAMVSFNFIRSILFSWTWTVPKFASSHHNKNKSKISPQKCIEICRKYILLPLKSLCLPVQLVPAVPIFCSPASGNHHFVPSSNGRKPRR